jgi:hypothetical protein
VADDVYPELAGEVR